MADEAQENTAEVTAPIASDGGITAPSTPTANSVSELPDWAQKLITDVRGEAAKYRTEAKTAADDALKGLTDKFASALGFKEDAPDPEALTKSLTESQAKAAQAARELAIFKAAAPAGADPSKLLDSNSFLTSVAGLDPADGAAVKSAIDAAIAANPNLKAVQAAAASGTELGGSQESGLITEEQLARMKPEEIDAALKEGKLRHLLS